MNQKTKKRKQKIKKLLGGKRDYVLLRGDCLKLLKLIPDNSIDSVVSDPPAGIEFMGKNWDKDKGGRDNWIAWLTSVLKEVYRVLKPGGHILIWSIPKTSHWPGMAIENAGFEYRDKITHIFGSGFPKSLNVSKALDKAAGKTRKVVGKRKRSGGPTGLTANKGWNPGPMGNEGKYTDITAPATPEAEQWDGWGTALKPAVEIWHLARKPLSEKTVAKNVLKWGTGALSIDKSRIRCDSDIIEQSGELQDMKRDKIHAGYDRKHKTMFRTGKPKERSGPSNPQGRFPADFMLTHSPDCRKLKKKTKVKGRAINRFKDGAKPFGGGAGHKYKTEQFPDEKIEIYACVPYCPVRILDGQSGHSVTKHISKPSDCGGNTWGGTFQTNRGARGHSDSGGASRFFYCKKAAPKEKKAGCEKLYWEKTKKEFIQITKKEWKKLKKKNRAKGNIHPTVKAVTLMEYFINMLMPSNGVVLDMFMGSGSTGCGALKNNFRFIGMELEKSSFIISKARIKYAKENK